MDKIETLQSRDLEKPVEKISEYPIAFTERRYKGCRGPDKSPRKVNINSVLNLKPFQQISDTTCLYQYTRNPSQKTPSNPWIWIGLFILVAIIIGIVIWILYKTRKENFDKVDDSDIVEFEEVTDG